MKIKLTKDLPAFRAGEILDTEAVKDLPMTEYYLAALTRCGYAEEVKDEIDIKEIRKTFQLSQKITINDSLHPDTDYWVIPEEESKWFTAY